MNFLTQLKQRNPSMYWYGWLNILAAVVCIIMMQVDDTIVLGINAWIKPLKFFLSTVIFCWTMGWFMHHLNKQRAVTIYTWVVILVLSFELVVIVWQAANGRLSHFNITTALYGLLFSLMGVAITLMTLWTLFIGLLFFRQKDFNLPMHYVWAIRIAILFFVFFAFEGGIMAAQLKHTVGAPDGSEGLPLLNWSRLYGDWRVAHFAGMHSLQIIPLFAWFAAKNKQQVFLFSCFYLLLVLFFLWQALKGIPLFF
ncbi:MAG: hypothetical protein K2Q24_13050 [Chitinophagaceae bacterium]|nr:hypothetical protein [Chitinophagaceae bacterium]